MMDFYQLLDATASVASLAMIVTAVWWYIVHLRKDQTGPWWINLVLYVGQALITADAWLNPNPLWIRIFHAAGLTLLTVLHLYHAYERWEAREREKAYRRFDEFMNS